MYSNVTNTWKLVLANFGLCGRMSVLVLLVNSVAYNQTEPEHCRGGSHDIVRPFLGVWDEFELTESGPILIGRLTTQLSTNNCVLTQSFMTPDSSFSYRSHGYVNPATSIWEETYVFSTGRYSKFQWIVDEDQLYTLRVGGSRQTNSVYWLLYTDVKPNEYLVIQQESNDGGQTWISADSTRIVRIE